MINIYIWDKVKETNTLSLFLTISFCFIKVIQKIKISLFLHLLHGRLVVTTLLYWCLILDTFRLFLPIWRAVQIYLILEWLNFESFGDLGRHRNLNRLFGRWFPNRHFFVAFIWLLALNLGKLLRFSTLQIRLVIEKILRLNHSFNIGSSYLLFFLF